MIARVSAGLQRVVSRVMPDPFVLALALTLLAAMLAAWRLQVAPPVCEGACDPAIWTLAAAWMRGFSNGGLLGFALQMCLVLVSGHALALSPAVRRAMDAIASLVRGPKSAAAIVSLVACGAAVLHWGLGAIAGALVARRVAARAHARGLRIHYGVMGAAAYTGIAVFHGGLSGSAPLKVAEPGHFLADSLGVVPLGQTLGSAVNLAVTPSLCVVFALVAAWMAMSPSTVEPPASVLEPDADEVRTGVVWGRLAGSTLLALVLGLLFTDRITFDINAVNLLFVGAGILLHGDLQRYVDAVADGARGAGAVILQYPFYFGIIELMKAGGLVEWLSEGLVSVATVDTFPIWSFFSAALVNFFIPSGGGQWAVQGPILTSAGSALGVAPGTIVMSFAYGDACTNLVQPFWALPLLGVMGLRARDIIGYCAVLCGVMVCVVVAWLAVLT